MFNNVARRLFLVLLGLFFLSGSNCGQNDPHPSHLGQPTAAYGTTGNANGGPGAQASSMNGPASVLANMISDYRARAGLPTVSANDVLTGVAQVQADDMATSNAVGLVGTDGADTFQRLANSGYAHATVAVIAAGYSTDPTAVYDSMLTDNGANGAMLGNSAFNSIGIGYSNGYWMVILGNLGTGTGTGTSTGSSSLQITTTTLAAPVWDAGLAGYSTTIAATGGTGTVTYTAGTGLPPGLMLSTSGSLAGTPTTASTYNFTVTAADSGGNTATKSYTLLINPAVSIVTTTVPNGTVGTAYNAPIQTAGGTGAITLSVTAGSLPPGITLSSSGGSGSSTSIFASSGLSRPEGLVFDTAGNLYISNYTGNTISKVTPAGATSTFVSSGLSGPVGLAFDTAGNLYVANFNASTITKVTPAGVTSTFVSSGLSGPQLIAMDTSGNLYIADFSGNMIVKVTPAGVSSNFVSSGLSSPFGLAFDAAGNLYVNNGNNITKVTPAGVTSTFVSGLNGPSGLTFDTAGNLYVFNNATNTISQVTPAGVMSTFISSGLGGGGGALVFDTAGNLYSANLNGNTVTKISAGNAALSGTPTTAGTFNFTVTATDTLGDTATQTYTVTIP